MDTRLAQAIIGAEKKQKKKCGRIPNGNTQSQKKTVHTLFGSQGNQGKKYGEGSRKSADGGSTPSHRLKKKASIT